MVDGIVAGFIQRTENAFQTAAENTNDENVKQYLYFPMGMGFPTQTDLDFHRYEGFNDFYANEFEQFAQEEAGHLIASGKSEKEAYKIADRHLLIRQKKFVEFVLNEEYKMYEKIHDRFHPAVEGLEKFEKYANTIPVTEIPDTFFKSDFNTAYNYLTMDYATIQGSFYPFPRMEINDNEKKLKCKPVEKHE